MDILVRIPVCNIITCEDILMSGDNKMYICNPFTGTWGRSIKKFYTYTVIQGIPNGTAVFKIQIMSPKGIIVKETEESIVNVEENIIRAKTKWTNICFNECGQHILRVLIKCNGEYDTVGCSNIYIM